MKAAFCIHHGSYCCTFRNDGAEAREMKVLTIDAHEKAKRALYFAKKAWNQLYDASGGRGDKFSHNLRAWIDMANASGNMNAELAAEAIRLHVVELNKARKKVGIWE